MVLEREPSDSLISQDYAITLYHAYGVDQDAPEALFGGLVSPVASPAVAIITTLTCIEVIREVI